MFSVSNLHNPFTLLESRNKKFLVRPALVLLNKTLAIEKAKVYAFVFGIEEKKAKGTNKSARFFYLSYKSHNMDGTEEKNVVQN